MIQQRSGVGLWNVAPGKNAVLVLLSSYYRADDAIHKKGAVYKQPDQKENKRSHKTTKTHHDAGSFASAAYVSASIVFHQSNEMKKRKKNATADGYKNSTSLFHLSAS